MALCTTVVWHHYQCAGEAWYHPATEKRMTASPLNRHRPHGIPQHDIITGTAVPGRADGTGTNMTGKLDFLKVSEVNGISSLANLCSFSFLVPKPQYFQPSWRFRGVSTETSQNAPVFGATWSQNDRSKWEGVGLWTRCRTGTERWTTPSIPLRKKTVG